MNGIVSIFVLNIEDHLEHGLNHRQDNYVRAWDQLRGRVGENLFKLESGVFGHGAERMHYGGDFVMHPRKKKKTKRKKKNALGVLPVTGLEREFKEGEIVDTKTGNAQLSDLQKKNGATIVRKAVWF